MKNVTNTKPALPHLRFPKFNGEWARKKIGKILKVERGASPRPISAFVSNDIDGISWIKIGDLENGSKYVLKTAEKISPAGAKMSRKVKPGDFILSNSMSFGRPYIVKIHGCIHDGWLALRNENGFVDDEFLYEILQTELIRKKFLSLAAGSAVKNLKSETVKDTTISFPSLEEQQKLASFLSAVNNWIENLEKQKSSLEEYKKGMMQKIFSREIRFKDEDGNEYPEWKNTKFGEIIKFLSDYTANGSFASLKENVSYYSSKNYAVLVRTTDLEKKNFSPKRFTDKRGYDYLKKTSLFGGEIILANVGSIGKVYKVPKYNQPMTLAPNTYVIKFNENICEDFIFHLMTKQTFKNKLLSMVGSSTLQAINKSNLRSIKITIPKFDEQKKIASFLSSIDRQIESREKQINTAKLWKKGLLQQMFV